MSESSSTARTGRITRTLVRAAEKLGVAEGTDGGGSGLGRGGGLGGGGSASQQTQQVSVVEEFMYVQREPLAKDFESVVGIDRAHLTELELIHMLGGADRR